MHNILCLIEVASLIDFDWWAGMGENIGLSI